MSPLARRRLVLAAPLLWMALIFAGSSIPGRRIPVERGWDKLAHAAEYAVLGFLGARALAELGMSRRRALVVAAAGCLAYGISDEVHQSFVPNRSVEAADVAADAVGGLAGAALAVGSRRRRS